jgi:hypothetical protein
MRLDMGPSEGRSRDKLANWCSGELLRNIRLNRGFPKNRLRQNYTRIYSVHIIIIVALIPVKSSILFESQGSQTLLLACPSFCPFPYHGFSRNPRRSSKAWSRRSPKLKQQLNFIFIIQYCATSSLTGTPIKHFRASFFFCIVKSANTHPALHTSTFVCYQIRIMSITG